MTIPRLNLRLIYRLLVTAICLPILAVVLFVLRSETDATGRLLLMIVAALIGAVAIAVWFRHIVAVYVQIVALPILAGVYFFELGRTDPVDEMLHIEQLWRLVKARRAAGQPTMIQYSPAIFAESNNSLALADGTRVLPLAGVADLPTIMCREGPRPFAEYVADEHGFNNPKGLWQKPVDLVLIGDSMTYGACLPERDHFIGQIRERYPATINLSNGGIGPLFYLAIAREFLPAIRPKYVFYMYDENNDLYFVNVPGRGDLVVEYRHDILRQYLEDDDFSQRMIERRQDIHSALRQLVENRIVAGLAERTLRKRIVKVLGLSLTRAGLRPSGGGPATPLAPPRVQLQPASSLAFHEGQAAPDVGLDADMSQPRPGLQQVGFDANDRSSRRRLAQQAGAAQPPQPAAPDYLEVFKTVFAKTLRVANDAGAKLVFVNIPAQLTVCDGAEHPWKKKLLDFVAESGVDMIDLEKDFRNAITRVGREQLFAVPPCGGHFSELGYKVIGDRLLQYLKVKDMLSSAEHVDAHTLLGEGWSYRARPDNAAQQPRQPPRIASRRTTLYEALRLETVWSRTADGPVRDKGTLVIADTYTPRRIAGRLRISAKLAAQSAAANEIVAALVVDGEVGGQRLVTRPIDAGGSESLSLTFERDHSGAPLDIELRAGPGRPGALNVNAADPRAVPLSGGAWLAIEEMSHSDQLLYTGTDLSEPELVAARRGDAERWRRSRPNGISRALVGMTGWVAARLATRKVFHHQQTYTSDAYVDRVIRTDGSIVTDRDGHAILGHSWRPKAVSSVVRVRVAVPAWSEAVNSIVAGLFLDGQPEPLALARRRLRPRQPGAALIDVEIAARAGQDVNLSVRVAPGAPGTVYLNSDPKPPIPNLSKPTLTIVEYAPFWR